MRKEIAFGINDYPTLLEEIRKRPSMWLGGEERSILLLSAFLGGLGYAEYIHAINEEKTLGGFPWCEYEQWVKTRYNPNSLSLDSFTLALHLSVSEKTSFDLWFKWYDDFRNNRNNEKLIQNKNM